MTPRFSIYSEVRSLLCVLVVNRDMVNRTRVLAPARHTVAAEAGEHNAARARTHRCKKQAVRRRGRRRRSKKKAGEEGEGRAQGKGAREERQQGRAMAGEHDAARAHLPLQKASRARVRRCSAATSCS